LEALEGGCKSEDDRCAIIDRETAKLCEELGILPATEAEKAAHRKACDAAKPDNWESLSSAEQTDWLIRYLLRDVDGRADSAGT
jgi:hypothetical protein